MRHIALAATALLALAGTANAKDAAKGATKDRACTFADIARFERMLGGIREGQYRTDPRFLITVHYLGTTIVKGTCNIRLRPAD
jgi:hypothetical protein